MGVITKNDSRRTIWLPNRIATYLLIVFGLAAAALPTAANMDWQSTAGILGGLAAIATACVTFLKGWQKNEQENLSEYRAAPSPPEVSPVADDLAALDADWAKLKNDLVVK